MCGEEWEVGLSRGGPRLQWLWQAPCAVGCLCAGYRERPLGCMGSREATLELGQAGQPGGACFEGLMVFQFFIPGAVLMPMWV